MKKLLMLTSLALLVGLIPSHRLFAAFTTHDLNLGSTFVNVPGVTLSSPGALNPLTGGHLTESNTAEGGGSIQPSTLDGSSLPFVYCIQIPVTVTVPGDYDKTQVSDNGTIDPAPNNNYPTLGSTPVTVRNAGQIAYLLDTFGLTATTNAQQAALQAAIWLQAYGGSIFSLNTGVSFYSIYLADLAALGQSGVTGDNGHTAPLSDVAWLTPALTSPDTTKDLIYFQALVTKGRTFSPNLPLPSGLVIWSILGAVGMVGLGWRRRTLAIQP